MYDLLKELGQSPYKAIYSIFQGHPTILYIVSSPRIQLPYKAIQ